VDKFRVGISGPQGHDLLLGAFMKEGYEHIDCPDDPNDVGIEASEVSIPLWDRKRSLATCLSSRKLPKHVARLITVPDLGNN